MYHRKVAVLHSLEEVERCVARLCNCSGLVRCQFLQSASFAIFRQGFMCGTPCETYFENYKLEHSAGAVNVWKGEAQVLEAAEEDAGSGEGTQTGRWSQAKRPRRSALRHNFEQNFTKTLNKQVPQQNAAPHALCPVHST